MHFYRSRQSTRRAHAVARACLVGLLCAVSNCVVYAFNGPDFTLPSVFQAGAFEIISGVENRNLGASVGSAGDFNGDGLGDLIVGAPEGTALDNPGWNGSAYIIYGTRGSGGGSPLVVENMSSAQGMLITAGRRWGSRFGFNVSGAGDLNGDGLDDIVVASSDPARPAGNPGVAVVVFGARNGPRQFDVDDVNGRNGFVIVGENPGDEAGHVVGRAGDVNGDGRDDLLISAPFHDTQGVTDSGRVYIVYGATSYPAQIDLSTLSPSTGVVLDAARLNGELGYSATGLGDFNADGFDDIAIGAFGVDPTTRLAAGEGSAIYVVYGAPGLGARIDLNQLDGADGFRFTNIRTDVVRGEVAWAGDVNGDGYDDFAVTMTNGLPNSLFHYRSVFYGYRQTAPRVDYADSALRPHRGGFFPIVSLPEDTSDIRRLHANVFGLGDLDNDGYDDLLLTGTEPREPDRATVNVRLGDRGMPMFMFDRWDYGVGFSVQPRSGDDYVGVIGPALGDINGDGFGDFAVADQNHSTDAPRSGRVQVILGRLETTGVGDTGHIYNYVTNGAVSYEAGGIDPTPDYPEPEQPGAGSGSGPAVPDVESSGVVAIDEAFKRGLVAEYLFEESVKDNSRWKNHLSVRGAEMYGRIRQRLGVSLKHRTKTGLVRRSNSRLGVRGHLSIAFGAKLSSNREYAPVVAHYTTSKLGRYYVPSFAVELLPQGTVGFVFRRPNDAFFWTCTSRPGVVNHGRLNDFVVTRNRVSGRINIFMNGRFVDGCLGPAGALASNGRQLYVGTFASGILEDATTDLFIDDLQLFSRLLSPAEVLAIENSRPVGSRRSQSVTEQPTRKIMRRSFTEFEKVRQQVVN